MRWQLPSAAPHGYYVETPHLAMKRLQEINKALDTPLVLHGGTGIPETS